MRVIHDRGIHLPDCDLWMDSLKARPVGVVTHAHSDHAAWHFDTILTPATAALMRVRGGYRKKTVRETDFDVPVDFKNGRVTLIPAGHVKGSAQAVVETDHGTLLYTGDFKLRPSRTSETARAVYADVLVMECTFGLPRYRFPAAEETLAAIKAFCRKAVEDRCIPVLLAYSLGKAQELLSSLAEIGLPVVLHSSVFKMSKVYEAFGTIFPEHEEWNERTEMDGKIVIYPPHERYALSRLPNCRFAIASGWAMDRGAIYRYRCDAAFPLSDHASYDELLQYVEMVSPKRVYTTHGFTEEFASDLRRRGIDALALGGVNQLEFQFK